MSKCMPGKGLCTTYYFAKLYLISATLIENLFLFSTFQLNEQLCDFDKSLIIWNTCHYHPPLYTLWPDKVVIKEWVLCLWGYLYISSLLEVLDHLHDAAEVISDGVHGLFLGSWNIPHLRAQCCVFGFDGLQVLQHQHWVLLWAQC